MRRGTWHALCTAALILSVLGAGGVLPAVWAHGASSRAPAVTVRLGVQQAKPGSWQVITVHVASGGHPISGAPVHVAVRYAHWLDAFDLPQTGAYGNSSGRFWVPRRAQPAPVQLRVTVHAGKVSATAGARFAVTDPTKPAPATPGQAKPTPTATAPPAGPPRVVVHPLHAELRAPKPVWVRVTVTEGGKPVYHVQVLAVADFHEGVVGLHPAYTGTHGRAWFWLWTGTARRSERVTVDAMVALNGVSLRARSSLRVLVARRQGKTSSTGTSTPTVPTVAPSPTQPIFVPPAATSTEAPGPPPPLAATNSAPFTEPTVTPSGAVYPQPTATPVPSATSTPDPPSTPPTAAPSATFAAPPSATATRVSSVAPTAAPPATSTDTPSATPTDTPTAPATHVPSATPTRTPTATPTRTPTATPSPSPTSPPTSSQNLISDGGFESSAIGPSGPPWPTYVQGSTPAPAITRDAAHSGNRSIQLGGPQGANTDGVAIAWERVTVPSSATAATLSFWYLPRANSCAGPAGDAQNAFLATTDASGNWSVLQSVLVTISDATAWQHVTADVSPAIGQTVNVAFEVVQSNDCWAGMYVDDVSLNVSYSGSPPPTATASPYVPPTATPTTPPPAATQPPAAGADQYQQQLLNLINGSRAQAGLPPYRFSLTQSEGTGSCVGSYGHSVHMAQEGGISHDQFPADVCISYRAAGENVGMGSGDESQVIQELHTSMMDEGPGGGHYDNIMSSTFTTVGIGLYYVNGALWLTEDFTG